MLELYEIIRVSHIIACSFVIILFYEWGWQGGVFIVTKNDHFLVFVAVYALFPKFLNR